MLLLTIDAPHFNAGLIPGARAAPIIRYMQRWHIDRIKEYCERKGWELTAIIVPSIGEA